MKGYVAPLLLAVAVTLPLAAQERIPPASSVMPAGYLQAMPTVERVLSDMTVADAVDTRARQAAAVSYLGLILSDLTLDHLFARGPTPGKVVSGLTPEEGILNRGYLDAWNRLYALSAEVPGLTALMRRYSAENSQFRRELLDRYFSPVWQRGLLAREQQIAEHEAKAKRATDSTARADSLAAAEESRPFLPAPVPAGERRFAMALTKWCRARPAEQGNPLAIEQVNREFMLRLPPIVNSSGPISDWSGMLLAITPGLGDASVTITVDTVSSYREGIGGAQYSAAAIVGAWVTSGTRAYAEASRVEVGQRVFFSGRRLAAGSEQFLSNDEGKGCGIHLGMELTSIRPAP
jgi:hypothetical protein